MLDSFLYSTDSLEQSVPRAFRLYRSREMKLPRRHQDNSLKRLTRHTKRSWELRSQHYAIFGGLHVGLDGYTIRMKMAHPISSRWRMLNISFVS